MREVAAEVGIYVETRTLPSHLILEPSLRDTCSGTKRRLGPLEPLLYLKEGL